MRRAICFIVFCLASLPAGAAEITWPGAFWNPAPTEDDLVLPLPCGGGLAFRRVDTPVPGDDPLADRKVQLGAADENTGFLDYYRSEHLRGPFSSGGEHYWIMKYELTIDQRAAIRGECAEPTLGGARPAGGLSWFEAVELSRLATEWLGREAPDAMPKEEDSQAFLRLPTEVEWEFAARGGTAVSPTKFRAPLFPMEGPPGDYAWFAGRDSANGNLRPIGRISPNPIGLYGMLGGVEEIVIEPFRLNALGRPHGQVGGFVTRGGSIETELAELRSSLRQENPFYSQGSGLANAYATFGARFVLSVQVNVSLARTNLIRERWLEGASARPELADDPLELLSAMRARETEKRRLQELATLKSFIVADRSARVEAAARALRMSIFNGAAMMQLLRSQKKRLDIYSGTVAVLEDIVARYAERADEAGRAQFEKQSRTLADKRLIRDEASDVYETVASGYLNTLTAIVQEHGEEPVREQAAVLKIELDGRGETRMVLAVDQFLLRSERLRAHPDLPRAVLIEEALR